MNHKREKEHLLKSCQKAKGMHYEDDEAKRILDDSSNDWLNYWSEVDSKGILTGDLVHEKDSDDYVQVDEQAMVLWDSLTEKQKEQVHEQCIDGLG